MKEIMRQYETDNETIWNRSVSGSMKLYKVDNQYENIMGSMKSLEPFWTCYTELVITSSEWNENV